MSTEAPRVVSGAPGERVSAAVAERSRHGALRRVLTAAATDGRAVMIASIAAYLGAVAAGRLVWRVDLWPLLGVPSGPSLFFDARNLTAAWECQRLGYDPLYANPCDPWGRPLMYLRPWLYLGFLGLDQSHTAIVASILIVAMFLSLGLLVGRLPMGAGIVLAIAACSPAVMFAVERANMDVALFSVVATSILLWRAWPRPARLISPMLVFLAATTKIYPAFALPAFLMTRTRTAIATTWLCIAGFAAYLVYNIQDVMHVAHIATQGDLFSYGARILPAHLYHQFGGDRWAGPAALKQMIAAVPLAVLAVVVVIRVRRRLRPSAHDVSIGSASMIALHAGTLIYLGTFVVANNFDYRLVFLLLTLPQLIEWARTPAHRLYGLARVTVAAILVLLWAASLFKWSGPWDELASWAVTGFLTAVLAVTLPSFESVRRTFGRPAMGSTA